MYYKDSNFILNSYLMEIQPGKKYLYVFIGIVLLAFSYASISYVRSYGDSLDPSLTRSFSVSGEGKVVAVPDIAQFSFSIITEGGSSIASLQKTNTEKANAIIDFIKSKDVAKEDIKTQGYSVSPRYQYYNCSPRPYSGEGTVEPCPPPEIVGFTITQDVSVKVRNFDITGDLLAGVVEHGASAVSHLSFTVDDPTALEQQAREEAIEKAKEKARATARAGGFRLGKLLSLNEGGFTPIYYKGLETAYAGGRGGELPAPTIEPGSQEITINVTLVYQIK